MIAEILLFLVNDPLFWIGNLKWFLMAGCLCLFLTFSCMFRDRAALTLFLIGVILIIVSIYDGAELYNMRPVTITPEHYEYVHEYQNITSLKDNSLTNGVNGEGHFFLGGGHMSISGGNSVPVYVFYKMVSEDEYMQGYIPSDGVYIKRENTTNPNIEWEYKIHTTEFRVYNDNGETFGGFVTKDLIKTTIHVPKNTIVDSDYQLDAVI